MSHKGLTWRVFFLIVLTDLGNSLAQLLMKKGLLHPAADFLNLKALVDFIAGNAVSPVFWLGILVYILCFFVWIVVLSKVDLSVAIPLACNDYVIIPLLAVVFLREHVSLLRWLGIAIIVCGVLIVSRSGKRASLEGGRS
jgi:drug/metabolite transporter (DMT)-like permease